MKINAVGLGAALALTAQACLLPEERAVERERALYGRAPLGLAHQHSKRANTVTTIPVGEGDRFDGGHSVPVGIGTDDRDFKSILNVDEVESGLRALADAYDDVDFFTLPYQTYEGRSVYGVSVGEQPRVYLEGGIHARERGGPDAVLYFLADLLRAREESTGLTYGPTSYSSAQVHDALAAGVVVVPLVNPDGVAHDFATDSCWRKNRNATHADGGNDDSVGIDLNRNFDILWDYKQRFTGIAEIQEGLASDDPASLIYHGASPLSEAETRNVAWALDHFGALSWMLDLHSASGTVLYAWSDDDPQTARPEQNFLNAAFDDDRGIPAAFPDADGSAYGEFIEDDDLASQVLAADRMSGAMNATDGSVPFIPVPVSAFTVSSGSSIDFGMSGYYGRRCGAKRIQGLGVEFGYLVDGQDCRFYPTPDLYHTSLRQVAVGFVELLMYAAGEAGDAKVWEC